MAEIEVLDVNLYENQVGTLTRLPGDRVLFSFNAAYVADKDRPTLSLSFKDAFGELLTDFKPTQTRLMPFFSNLLPEGAMRDYLARRARANPAREFFLAWALGKDLPGALTIVSATGKATLPPQETSRDESPSEPSGPAALRFSLAGVQLKFSAVRDATGGLTIPVDGTGGSWIVKLPSTSFSGVPENEFAMMTLAERVGIDVPRIRLVPIEEIKGLPPGVGGAGKHAFAIQRFDRSGNGGAIHIEDFAQIFGVYPEDKYERASYRNIAEVLWIETGEAGVTEFLRRFVFNALIGNADMHLKNWSVTYPDRRRAALSPAYDFVATLPYIPDDRLALTFVNSKAFSSLSYAQFARFAAKAGLPEKLTLDTVRDAVSRFREAWKNSDDLEISGAVRISIDANISTIPIWNEQRR